MSSVVGVIRDIVRGELAELRFTELAVVEPDGPHPHADPSDQDNYSCDVRLRNGGLLLRKVPVATDRVGTVAVPNEGDLVLVAFSHGDVNQPVVVGRLYADDDRPPVNRPDEFVFRLPLADPDDRTVQFEIRNLGDATPPREFVVRMAPKTELRVHDADAELRVGDTRVRLAQPGSRDGEVRIEAGRSVVTIAQDGDVTVDAAGALTFRATGDVSISGANVEISSRLATTVTAGTELSASGKVGATVDGGMSATVRGRMVSVSGITSFGP
jgi:phage baseplate assembly protein gpV